MAVTSKRAMTYACHMRNILLLHLLKAEGDGEGGEGGEEAGGGENSKYV